jgi:antitoxin component of MazEF toxin-antitoxin module
MKSLSIQVKKVGGSLMIPIPLSIAELMDWVEGDFIKVPFHEFEKEPKRKIPNVTEPESTGKESVTVKIGTHEPKEISQADVIKILDDPKPSPELKIYRTAYIEWNGKQFGVKNVCKQLFGFDDFNTIQGDKYLRELGFPTFRKQAISK